jgi:hypothetical protein
VRKPLALPPSRRRTDFRDNVEVFTAPCGTAFSKQFYEIRRYHAWHATSAIGSASRAIRPTP